MRSKSRETPRERLFIYVELKYPKNSHIDMIFRPGVIVCVDPLNAALENAMSVICTLGNWIYNIKTPLISD